MSQRRGPVFNATGPRSHHPTRGRGCRLGLLFLRLLYFAFLTSVSLGHNELRLIVEPQLRRSREVLQWKTTEGSGSVSAGTGKKSFIWNSETQENQFSSVWLPEFLSSKFKLTHRPTKPFALSAHGNSCKRMRRYSICPRSPSNPMPPVAGTFSAAFNTSPLQVQ